MSRDPELRLEDILEAALAIDGYVQGFRYDRFISDRRTVDAVIRNLEIIGVAVKYLPDQIKAQHPEIPWRAIAGFEIFSLIAISKLMTLSSGIQP